MTDRSATGLTAPSPFPATPHNSANMPLCFALPGSEVNPRPSYLLACFDSGGTRNYWLSTSLDFVFAPALGGGLTYVAATLVVEGRA